MGTKNQGPGAVIPEMQNITENKKQQLTAQATKKNIENIKTKEYGG